MRDSFGGIFVTFLRTNSHLQRELIYYPVWLVLLLTHQVPKACSMAEYSEVGGTPVKETI